MAQTSESGSTPAGETQREVVQIALFIYSSQKRVEQSIEEPFHFKPRPRWDEF